MINLTAYGIIYCFLFFFFRNKKADGIKHYERIRDKLTLRELEKEEEEVIKDEPEERFNEYINEERPAPNITDLAIGVVVMGLMIFIEGTILTQLSEVQSSTNVTTTSTELLASVEPLVNLIPIMIVLMVIGIILIVIARLFSD